MLLSTNSNWMTVLRPIVTWKQLQWTELQVLFAQCRDRGGCKNVNGSISITCGAPLYYLLVMLGGTWKNVSVTGVSLLLSMTVLFPQRCMSYNIHWKQGHNGFKCDRSEKLRGWNWSNNDKNQPPLSVTGSTFTQALFLWGTVLSSSFFMWG